MSQPEIALSQASVPRSDQSVNRARAVVNKAKSLIGLPWVHCARSSKDGVDCAGLIVVCAEAIGIEIPHLGDYDRLEPQSSLLGHVLKYCTMVSDMQPGDLITMSWPSAPSHIVIYIGDDWFVHAIKPTGVTQQQLIPYWRRRITGVYRLNNID